MEIKSIENASNSSSFEIVSNTSKEHREISVQQGFELEGLKDKLSLRHTITEVEFIGRMLELSTCTSEAEAVRFAIHFLHRVVEEYSRGFSVHIRNAEGITVSILLLGETIDRDDFTRRKTLKIGLEAARMIVDIRRRGLFLNATRSDIVRSALFFYVTALEEVSRGRALLSVGPHRADEIRVPGCDYVFKRDLTGMSRTAYVGGLISKKNDKVIKGCFPRANYSEPDDVPAELNDPKVRSLLTRLLGEGDSVNLPFLCSRCVSTEESNATAVILRLWFDWALTMDDLLASDLLDPLIEIIASVRADYVKRWPGAIRELIPQKLKASTSEHRHLRDALNNMPLEPPLKHHAKRFTFGLRTCESLHERISLCMESDVHRRLAELEEYRNYNVRLALARGYYEGEQVDLIRHAIPLLVRLPFHTLNDVSDRMKEKRRPSYRAIDSIEAIHTVEQCVRDMTLSKMLTDALENRNTQTGFFVIDDDVSIKQYKWRGGASFALVGDEFEEKLAKFMHECKNKVPKQPSTWLTSIDSYTLAFFDGTHRPCAMFIEGTNHIESLGRETKEHGFIVRH